MLKYLFALTLLAPIAFCQVDPEERQWQDSDNRQNCTIKCELECKNCTMEPQYCTDDQIKCGERLQPGQEDCPPDDVCVPDNCECSTNEDCPLICDITCNEDELLCPGGNNNGCKENDFCQPKGTGDGGHTCPGYCPEECDPTTYKCTFPPFMGCEVKPICIPKKAGNNGICPDQHCPAICDWTTEEHCMGLEDDQGCAGPEQCVPKCVQTCPIVCSPGDIKCVGQTNCATGCKEPDTCKVKTTDVNNQACPDNSYSHDCPVVCCDDSVLCDPATTQLGCLEEAVCHPVSKDNDDNNCPIASDCPKNCEPHEVKCPKTGTDDNGCKVPDICITQERDWNGKLCTVHCPLECNDVTETYCPGQRNEMGCFEPDQCVEKATKTKGSDKGGLCPGWCPPICATDEVKCPSQVDPCDGCPTEEICREIVTDKNNQDCPLDPLSASHNCPILCEDGEVLCPAKMNPNGCKDAGVCKKRTLDKDDQFCPAHSVCPSNCDSDEKACNYGEDARGCQEATLCRARGTNGDDDLCPGVCPPTCTKEETLWSGGVDQQGCEVTPTCTLIN